MYERFELLVLTLPQPPALNEQRTKDQVVIDAHACHNREKMHDEDTSEDISEAENMCIFASLKV